MRFPSEAWLAAVVEAVNRHPDLPRALAGLGPDLAAVVEADPPAFPAALAAWGRHQRGYIAEWRLLGDEDEILELEPAYVVRGPYRLWKDLLLRQAQDQRGGERLGDAPGRECGHHPEHSIWDRTRTSTRCCRTERRCGACCRWQSG